MKKIVYIAPHLSTGGMPQYLFKEMELLQSQFQIYCIEWSDVTGGVLVVQRNKIKNLLGANLITLGDDKTELFKVINSIKPDVVHLQEVPELFMEYSIAEKLYSPDRKYVIIETSHDSSIDTNTKVHFPDKFLLVSQYQIENFKKLNIPCDLVEYPIEYKTHTKTRDEALIRLGLDPNVKHVINVGLFTPRKNQAEVIEYAKELINYPIQFHFLGNCADNFKWYWEPLMKDFPTNCKWWNEVTNVDDFYEAADLFLFTSRGSETDKETMPLVIREAIGWKTPSLIYDLPVYLKYFDKYDNISYLNFDSKQGNVKQILYKLSLRPELLDIFYTMKGEERLTEYSYFNSTMENLEKYGDGAAQYFATFILKELEQGGLTIEPGDSFIDLGANIGMSARYAKMKGAGKVVCYEPDPKLIELIRKNVSSVAIHMNAISPVGNHTELYHWPYNEVNRGPTYTAAVLSLKNILLEHANPLNPHKYNQSIDYLKIDIEGFEENLFDDITREECSRIKKIFIEHHNPNTTESLCKKLRDRGFELQIQYGSGQNYIYGKQSKTMSDNNIQYKINSRWNLETQTLYYSTNTNINFPIIVSIKEYKSDAVLWATQYDNLPTGMEFWMIPVPLHVHKYLDDPYFSGIKVCIYNAHTNEQIYEYPYFHKFVNVPTISMSNFMPYYTNYKEFFIDGKYDKFLNKKFDFVIDAGANIGVFSKYLLEKKLTKNIIAIECDSIALKDLQRNFDTDDRVTVVPKALSATYNPVTFYQSKDNPVISSTLPPDKLQHHLAGVKGDNAYTVDAITISDLISISPDQKINLLKIDIEGGEYNIIEKAEDSIFENIDNLLIECHWFESNYMELYTNLLNKLTRLGYHIEEYAQNQVVPGRSESIFATRK